MAQEHSDYISAVREVLHGELGKSIPLDDYREYSAARKRGDRMIRTSFRVFQGEKIEKMVLEEYLIRHQHGIVLNIFPLPDYDLPIFTFQFGGRIPEKVLFLLDIVPVHPEIDTEPIRQVYEHRAAELQVSGTSLEWVETITSPYALVCQYEPLDPEAALESLRDYIAVWRDEYFRPAQQLSEASGKERAADEVRRFKSILHENDAGLPAYNREFGRAMAETIVEAAFGSGFTAEEEDHGESPSASAPEDEELWKNEKLGVKWSREAQQYVQEAPKAVRSTIRKKAEKVASERGLTTVTTDIIENMRK